MPYQYDTSTSMERVLYNLHHRTCTYALRHTSSKGRNLLERTVLILSVCGFGALLLAHLSFVYKGASLDMKRSIPVSCLSSLPGFDASADVTHVIVSELEPRTSFVREELSVEGNDLLFSYSPIKGYLLLPTDLCKEKGLKLQTVTISGSDVGCFGEPFLQKLIFRVIGPETVALNWLLAIQNATGFVYNPKTDEIIDLAVYSNAETTDSFSSPETCTAVQESRNWTTKIRQIMSKLSVVIKTSFLFFITTTLVSFTLRETQERMLDFTHQLQAHVRSNRSVVHLVTTHLVENLVFVPIMVGMIFFLIEFYRGDKILAFMVVSLVFLCEVFTVVSLRSSSGIYFFPRIFFLLFSLFHFYVFSFPFGFAYTALVSTVCFMAHSMLFFWHRYELPAVAHGLVNIERPRMGIPMHPSPVSIPSLHSEPSRPQTSVPTVNLPPRQTIFREHSHATLSSSVGGRLSQNTSSLGGQLFNRDLDGDETGSYLFFMNGEVVMHRRTPSPSTVNGSVDSSLQGYQTITADEYGDSHRYAEGGIPDRILADVGLLGPDPMDESRTEYYSPERHHGSDPPEMSSLQAILDAHETPRTENLSHHSPQRSTDSKRQQDSHLIRTAPTVPRV